MFKLMHPDAADALLDFVEAPTAENLARAEECLKKHPPIDPLIPYDDDFKKEALEVLKAGAVIPLLITDGEKVPLQPIRRRHTPRKFTRRGLDA